MIPGFFAVFFPLGATAHCCNVRMGYGNAKKSTLSVCIQSLNIKMRGKNQAVYHQDEDLMCFSCSGFEQEG